MGRFIVRVSSMGEIRNVYKILVRKPEETIHKT